MRYFLPVPFLIYWLVVTDFRYDLDVCNSFNETGFCLSNLQCSNIGQGKHIGSCDSEASGSVCCKITLNFFNKTYLLSRIFAKKSQTEERRQMTLVSANTCGGLHIIYGNKSISPGRKKKIVQFDPDLHVSISPDRIMWPIYASYSRESRDLRKQSSGQNYLYVVILDKLDANETVASECLSESNETESEDKSYVLVNPTSHFPIRKFFTPEIQKLNTMNLTLDAKSSFGIEPDKRSRRSVYHGMCNEDDSTCRKQEWEDIINANEEIDIESGPDTDQNIHKQMKSLKEHENIKSVRKYVLESKSKLNEFMEIKDMNKEHPIDKNKDETPRTSVAEESIYDSKKEKSNDLEVKGTIKFESPSLSVKKDSVPVKGNVQIDIDANIGSADLAIHNLRNSTPIESSHHINYPLQVESTDNIQKSVKVEDTNNMRKPLKVDATGDLKKPVQIEDTYDLRIPVQTEATHDSRKAVQKESTHDMRIPVQIHTDHNMRKPIQIVRESVKIEVTHDLRKPVVLNESHDLRWPVLDGETDLRSLRIDSNESDKLDDSRSKISGNRNARLDDFSLDCNVGISFTNKNSDLDSTFGKEKEFNDVWKEATRVCGKYTEDTTENSRRKVKGEWPWMVYLHEKRSGKFSHKCSAALLNNLWIITVAHCVDMQPKSDLKLLLLGSANGTGNYTEVDIDEIIVHPRFNRRLLENDIGLLRIKTPVAFQSTISPICFPWSVGELQYGTPVFLGRELKDQRNSDDLEKRTVPLITNYECEVLYSTGKNKEKIKDTFLCAAKDEESCDSESGSSLIAPNAEGRWSLIGLVSWGSMCESPEQPGVYVRISSYAQWIKDVIDCYENL